MKSAHFYNFLKNVKNKPELGYSLWMFFAQVGVSSLAFLLTYVLANYVSNETVGSYRYILAVYSSISVFALIGLSTALSHSVSNGKTGSFFYAVKVKFKYSCFAVLIFFVMAAYAHFFQGNTTLGLALVIAGLTFPIIETFALYLPYLNGCSDFKKSALFLLTNRLLTTIFLVGVIFLNETLVSLMLAYCLGQILSVVILYSLTIASYPPNQEVDGDMLVYAKHVTLMSVIGAVTAQLDKYILFIFFGPVYLAKFWIASVLPQEVNRGVSIIVNTFFPRFASGGKTKNKSDAKKLYLISCLGMIVIIGGYVMLAPMLFAWLLPLHVDVVYMSSLLMIAYGFVPYYFVWQIFSAQKEVKIMYILNTLEPIILVVCYLILVPMFGVFGIIYTIFIKNLVFNVHGLYYVFNNKT
jgi:O-antigen/teichoic acid export membrane protein